MNLTSKCVTESRDELPSLFVCNPLGRARIYLHGAHVVAFRPVGKGEVLWVSGASHHAPGKPIRGGIPLCFPWFGAHPDKPNLPAHGFARLTPFEWVASEDLPDGQTRIVLELRANPDTQRMWPEAFVLRCEITVGSQLKMALRVENAGATPFSFEQALHTYFDVSDVRTIAVHGLENTPFFDKLTGEFQYEDEPVRIVGETDRVYPDNDKTCEIVDPQLNRRIVVAKSQSRTTVVWNPWVAKARRMADFGDEEWPTMLCVESANTAKDKITLAPGDTHTMGLTVSVSPLAK